MARYDSLGLPLEQQKTGPSLARRHPWARGESSKQLLGNHARPAAVPGPGRLALIGRPSPSAGGFGLRDRSLPFAGGSNAFRDGKAMITSRPIGGHVHLCDNRGSVTPTAGVGHRRRHGQRWSSPSRHPLTPRRAPVTVMRGPVGAMQGRSKSPARVGPGRAIRGDELNSAMGGSLRASLSPAPP